MTNTREVERHGPPSLLLIPLAIFMIGLQLEVGAAFALARLSADGRARCGASRSEFSDVVPDGPTTLGDGGPPACGAPIAGRAGVDARLAP